MKGWEMGVRVGNCQKDCVGKTFKYKYFDAAGGSLGRDEY